MVKKQHLIVGNWKMYPKTKKEALVLARGVNTLASRNSSATVVIAAPFPYIGILPKSKKVFLGAQDLFYEKEGAFTGEVSASMLKDMGVSYVIVGHSERRKYFYETDAIIGKKTRAALSARLTPIICVGEGERDHDGAFFGVVKKQLEESLSILKRNDIGKIVIAYEPVWAIGSKNPARPHDANEMALFIKKTIAQRAGSTVARRVPILYGGSVDSKNAVSFLVEREVSGLLVGGASHNVQEFTKILLCAQAR